MTEENNETYFVRQPRNVEEIAQAYRAARVCCVNAIRYGGREAWIIRRLGNTPQFADHPIRRWKFWR